MTTGDFFFVFLTLTLVTKRFTQAFYWIDIICSINLDVQFLNLPLQRALTVRKVCSTVIKIHSLHDDTTIFFNLKNLPHGTIIGNNIHLKWSQRPFINGLSFKTAISS